MCPVEFLVFKAEDFEIQKEDISQWEESEGCQYIRRDPGVQKKKYRPLKKGDVSMSLSQTYDLMVQLYLEPTFRLLKTFNYVKDDF